MTDLPLTKLAETTSTITLGWTPIPCLGYVLYADGVRKSNSWDQTKSSWKTAKAGEIRVVALGAEATGVWPPPTPPPATGIAPPQAPITTVTNAPGLGLNVTTLQHYADYVIDGTGETAVLFQLNAGGSSLKRARLLRVAVGNSVTYGKHAVYGKAPGLLLEDIVAECTANCASGLSMRFDGAVVRRFSVSGAPHAITYYETSSVAGTVLFEDGVCSFTADTGVWVAPETDYQTKVRQAFTFKRVAMTGPGAFMKVASGFVGSVRLEGCTLNGKPVTAAGLPGVPNVSIV